MMVTGTDSKDAVALVRSYLAALGERDLVAAGRMLSPNAQIVSVGGRRFSNPGEMVAAAKSRYQSVRKDIASVDVIELSDTASIVYIIGTLHGISLAGAEYSGVRFIDRFVVQDGQIVSQDIWNDLAERGVVPVGRS